MNQTFNPKRFLRYTRFILSMNRWYYGIALVFFTIPATVLSLCGVADWLVAGLVGWSAVTINMAPFADLAKFGGRARLLTIPASWLEKLVLEYTVRFLPIVVPFGLHAAGCAIGLNRVSGYLADGFDVARLLEIIFWMAYMNLLSFDSGKLRTNPILGTKQISTSWFLSIYFGFMVFLFMLNPTPPFYDMLGAPILLIFSALAIMATLVFYRRRRVK